ncbi:MAG: transglycosylase SLT domain-containing protein [Bradyrhizobium sp.]
MPTGLLFRSVLALAVALPAAGAAEEKSPPPAQPGIEEPQPSEPVNPAGATEAARPSEKESDTRESICLMIESAARESNLPLEFFARVIWQESRFRPDAVGPMTRSGQRAQGIAQFMPGTAGERGLLDPFNPVQALPKSAQFLAELREQFGNLGLAAAAYNAGPRRVQEWLAGSGGMPGETRNYVYAITGSSVDEWAKAARASKLPERMPTSSCRELMALLKQAPNPFIANLEQHVTLAAARQWGVQLAAGFSRDKALAMYGRAVSRLSSVIGDRDPSILTSRLRNRGPAAFYQVRFGADTRAEADELCNRIRKAGGACFVLRNRV